VSTDAKGRKKKGGREKKKQRGGHLHGPTQRGLVWIPSLQFRSSVETPASPTSKKNEEGEEENSSLRSAFPSILWSPILLVARAYLLEKGKKKGKGGKSLWHLRAPVYSHKKKKKEEEKRGKARGPIPGFVCPARTPWGEKKRRGEGSAGTAGQSRHFPLAFHRPLLAAV